MEKNVEDKQSYKISEIAIALREYLKEGYNILNEMLSLIDIKSDYPYKTVIKIAQGDADNLFSEHIIYKDKPYDGKILLFISKSGFSPLRMIRNYKTRYVEEENPLYSVDNADFIIKKEVENFVFERRYNHDISRMYRPKLNILDIDKFSKLYQRLEEEGYLTYPSILFFHKEKPYFSFGLSSQCITLEQIQRYNRELWINYDPSNDSLYVKDSRKNPELTAEQMFNLEIPKEEIYKGYTSIIDKNLINEERIRLYYNNKPMVLKKTR